MGLKISLTRKMGLKISLTPEMGLKISLTPELKNLNYQPILKFLNSCSYL